MEAKSTSEIDAAVEIKPSTSDALILESAKDIKIIPPKRRKPVEGVAIDGINPKRFKLKRRKIKVDGAPKMPLTGYVRYMNARREQLRVEQPTKTAIEHTKIIGEEWNQLSNDLKAPYLADAEVDRQRYLSELNAFLKDHPDILASEIAKNKVCRKSQNGNPKSVLTDKTLHNGSNGNNNENPQSSDKSYSILKSSTNTDQMTNKSGQNINSLQNNNKMSSNESTTTTLNGRDPVKSATDPSVIQIFTDDFLDHNKTVDLELRTLRKSNTDLEMQNSVLEKYIDNMRFGVEKMENENNELEEKNRLLEAYLDKLKLKLASAFSGLGIPSEPNGATLDNIEKYMYHLYNMSTSNTHGPASLNKAKDIIRKLDLHIQL